jgi:hypothetical protein
MWMHRLFHCITERRRGPRLQIEGLVAYYWTGSIPKPKVVRNVGLYGACIVAADTFYPRTVLQIVLEDADKNRDDGLPTPHICVCGRVCRKTSNGFCVEFLFSDYRERLAVRRFLKGLKRNDHGGIAVTVPRGAEVEGLEGTRAPCLSGLKPEEAPTPGECRPESEDPTRPETNI